MAKGVIKMQEFLVCDLETTGIEPRQDKIIEIGLVKVEKGKVKKTFSRMVNPGIPLPAKIKRLTGLKDHILKKKPHLEDVTTEIRSFIEDLPLIGHNVYFDAAFLEYHLGLEFSNSLDTLELARIIYPNAPGYRLVDLCNHLNIEHTSTHRALSDALATAQLALALMKRINDLSLASIIHINNFLKQARSTWATYTSTVVKTKTGTFPGETLKIQYPTPPSTKSRKKSVKTGHQSVPVRIEDIEKIFSMEGPLKKQLSHFEFRPQQIKMATSVADTLNKNKCLLMEAGTGTGKSLAYLIPSLMWTLANGHRTVVATQTINLQEQLWNKDIPILKELMNEDFSAALVKGRSNYICLRRWDAILSKQEHFARDEALFFARLLVWLNITQTGDKNELNLNHKENEYWFQVCSDPDICQSSYCRWFNRHCFVSRARKAAENSDIIITNHSLLFSDLRAENKILPSFGPLIIDEAHHLEDAATLHLGRQVSLTIIKQWLQSFYKTMGKLSEIIPPRDEKQWSKLLQQAKQERTGTADKATHFFDTMGTYIHQTVNESNFNISFRLRPGEEIHQLLKVEGTNLITALKSAVHSLKEIFQLLEIWGATDELWLEYAWEVKELIISGNTIAGDLEFISSSNDENHVYWAEQNGEKNVNLIAAPVRVGELLSKSLLKHESGIILTSATLTANESFQYFMERTGVDLLPENRVQMKVVPSPFNYEQQCILCIDTSMEIPGKVDEETYFDRLAGALAEYIQAAEGRTLVLFTSHHALKETYFRLKTPMEKADICLLAHKLDGSRTRLIEQFQSNSRSVLLGASSFWEGVDIPGAALCSVIIVKLPFWPPTMPVIEARLEDLNRKGHDGFSQFTLPQAVIRFKQGFGRLIRTSRDKGCVIIMDKRLVTQKYGKVFLNSLPLKTHLRGDTRIIKNKIVQRVREQAQEPRWTLITDVKDVKRQLEIYRNRHI